MRVGAKERNARDKDIFDRVYKGEPLRAVGVDVGLGAERVRQIYIREWRYIKSMKTQMENK